MPFELTPEFNDVDRGSRHARIRKIFSDRGANSLLSFAEYLQMETDVYTKAQKAEFELRGIKADARRALKGLDEHGLSHAGPTVRKSDAGAPIWAPRLLFSYEDYCLAFGTLRRFGRQNLAMADRYAAECLERFQKLPVEDWQPAGKARERDQSEGI